MIFPWKGPLKKTDTDYDPQLMHVGRAWRRGTHGQNT